VSHPHPGSVRIDIEADLHLSLKKDLGICSWTADGIFINPDITVPQVQNIARLIHAKHGRPCPAFNECMWGGTMSDARILEVRTCYQCRYGDEVPGVRHGWCAEAGRVIDDLGVIPEFCPLPKKKMLDRQP
jgi:hypothetical protein